MKTVNSCDEFINNLLSNGAIIINEKNEGSESFYGRRVILKKDHCAFKVDYLNLNGKEIIVQKTCFCEHTKNRWINIPKNCINM